MFWMMMCRICVCVVCVTGWIYMYNIHLPMCTVKHVHVLKGILMYAYYVGRVSLLKKSVLYSRRATYTGVKRETMWGFFSVPLLCKLKFHYARELHSLVWRSPCFHSLSQFLLTRLLQLFGVFLHVSILCPVVPFSNPASSELCFRSWSQFLTQQFPTQRLQLFLGVSILCPIFL